MTFNKNSIFKDQGGARQTFQSGATQLSKSGSNFITEANVGTAESNITVVESGNAFQHTSILTLASVAATIGDNASLGTGSLLYTFPAGEIIVDCAFISVGVNLTTGTPTTDTPEVGLGTVIATGAVAVLSGTSTFEDIITGTAAADIAGTATVLTAIPTANVPLVIAAADAHTVFFNLADAWADVDDTAATLSGTVVLNWKFLN